MNAWLLYPFKEEREASRCNLACHEVGSHSALKIVITELSIQRHHFGIPGLCFNYWMYRRITKEEYTYMDYWRASGIRECWESPPLLLEPVGYRDIWPWSRLHPMSFTSTLLACFFGWQQNARQRESTDAEYVRTGKAKRRICFSFSFHIISREVNLIIPVKITLISFICKKNLNYTQAFHCTVCAVCG